MVKGPLLGLQFLLATAQYRVSFTMASNYGICTQYYYHLQSLKIKDLIVYINIRTNMIKIIHVVIKILMRIQSSPTNLGSLGSLNGLVPRET